MVLHHLCHFKESPNEKISGSCGYAACGMRGTPPQTPIAIYDFGLQRPSTASNVADTSGQPQLSASLLVAATSPGMAG